MGCSSETVTISVAVTGGARLATGGVWEQLLGMLAWPRVEVEVEVEVRASVVEVVLEVEVEAGALAGLPAGAGGSAEAALGAAGLL